LFGTLISSDSLFIKDKQEWYEFAISVVELRRQQGGIDAAGEEQWVIMFELGIYYANLVYLFIYSFVLMS
jgi:hypothetical protein